MAKIGENWEGGHHLSLSLPPRSPDDLVARNQVFTDLNKHHEFM